MNSDWRRRCTIGKHGGSRRAGGGGGGGAYCKIEGVVVLWSPKIEGVVVLWAGQLHVVCM
jgi:hypothetical protein